jgi:transcriptional regulator of arginine metabolism
MVIMERAERLSVLKRIIETKKINSQEVLLQSLAEEGIRVTQATLSRDLKYLQVGKIPDGNGDYLYAFSDAPRPPGTHKNLREDFKRGYLSINFSGNFALLKTLPGHAGSVAFALDNLEIEEILGTIAGDDTILVVPRDGIEIRAILAVLEAVIPGFRELAR